MLDKLKQILPSTIQQHARHPGRQRWWQQSQRHDVSGLGRIGLTGGSPCEFLGGHGGYLPGRHGSSITSNTQSLPWVLSQVSIEGEPFNQYESRDMSSSLSAGPIVPSAKFQWAFRSLCCPRLSRTCAYDDVHGCTDFLPTPDISLRPSAA